MDRVARGMTMGGNRTKPMNPRQGKVNLVRVQTRCSIGARRVGWTIKDKRVKGRKCLVCKARGGKEENQDQFVGGLNPQLEMAIPRDQRPVNELASLRNGPLSSWANLELPSFIQRLSILWATSFVVCSPVAAASFSPKRETLEFLLCSGVGATLIQAVVVLRIFTSWSYVSKRLLSAAIEYEETGWYDGQIFLKPPEILARDRLLGTYEVKPIIAKLQLVLYGSLGGFGAMVLSLILLSSTTDTYAAQKPSPRMTESGILYNKSISNMNVLKESDEAAAMEALAQKGRPGYCGDEYFRALAGGSAAVCGKFFD